LDVLEQRLAPSTFIVDDPGNDPAADPSKRTAKTAKDTITLVSAMQQNDFDQGGDTIKFSLMTVNTGAFTSYKVTIDGESGVIIDNGGVLACGPGSMVLHLSLIDTSLNCGPAVWCPIYR
jgi:hypothetical protein